MTADNREPGSFAPPEDFFRETPEQLADIEATRSLGKRLFSPVSFMRRNGIEIHDIPKFIKVLDETPGLITRKGERYGVKGQDVDLLADTLTLRSFDLLFADVFAPELKETVNIVACALTTSSIESS